MSIRNVQSAARVAALVLALPAAAGAQTVWTGATGSWFDAGNWSAGVPDASADARIDNTGTCTVASTGAAARSVTLGFDATDSGTLDVDTSATLDVAADLSVGYGGNGALWIGAGSIVNDYSGEIGYTIDSSSGVHGDAIVDGAGTQWNHAFELYVGYGTGTLSITNGASSTTSTAISAISPNRRAIRAAPRRSTARARSGRSDANLHIGDGGTGVVTVGDGGATRQRRGRSRLQLRFGRHRDDYRCGSSWTTNGFLYVGKNGNGT